MAYVVATDVGGTCTDTVVIGSGDEIIVGKALSTPPNFAAGVIDSIRSAAESMDVTLEALFADTFHVRAWLDSCRQHAGRAYRFTYRADHHRRIRKTHCWSRVAHTAAGRD